MSRSLRLALVVLIAACAAPKPKRSSPFENCVCGGWVRDPRDECAFPTVPQCLDDSLRREGVDPEKSCGRNGVRIADFAKSDGGTTRPLKLPSDLD